RSCRRTLRTRRFAPHQTPQTKAPTSVKGRMALMTVTTGPIRNTVITPMVVSQNTLRTVGRIMAASFVWGKKWACYAIRWPRRNLEVGQGKLADLKRTDQTGRGRWP